jgi:hypothetical protein
MMSSYEWTRGFHRYGERTIWLSVSYETPEGLARTVAHEAVHYWQDRTRRSLGDEMEQRDREPEAQQRSLLLVPKGSIRTPRGRARDAWFEPARRRYR